MTWYFQARRATGYGKLLYEVQSLLPSSQLTSQADDWQTPRPDIPDRATHVVIELEKLQKSNSNLINLPTPPP